MARPRQVTDREILDAARAVFLEHGPGASTVQIAEQVGVSQAALFKRFQTKERLMLAALAPPPRPPFVDRIERGPEPGAVPEQLTEIGGAMLAFLRAMVPCMMVLKSSAIDPAVILTHFEDPPPLLVRRALAGWFERARAARLMRCGEPLHLAQHFMGALHVRAFLGHVFPAQSPLEGDAAYVEHLVSTLWHGIAPAEVS